MGIERFVFRGNAVGTAGHIERPEDVILWVQGASSLPVIGGYSRTAVDRVAYGKYLVAESVKTNANGSFSAAEKAYKTVANSSVRNVSVAERLTAELFEATLISTHPAGPGQPSIVPTGTSISNLRLDGYPVEVVLDLEMFTKYCTFDGLTKAYTNDDAFFKKYGARFGPISSTARGKRQIPTTDGHVLCSIVSMIKTDHPQATVTGNAIKLRDYGTIYLGELVITSVSRRMTLLRTKLGSPIAGEIACAEVENNGIFVGF